MSARFRMPPSGPARYTRRALAKVDSHSRVLAAADAATQVERAVGDPLPAEGHLPAGRVSSARSPGGLLGALPDLFWLGPGFALTISVLVVTMFTVATRELALGFVFAMTLMFVGPHYAATYRRAFASRAIVRSHPFVTLVAPFLLIAAVVASVRWPARIGAPFFALYVLWSGYHYSGQSLGLALLFPLRQGARLSATEKRWVAVPLYASWLLSILGLLTFTETARNPAYTLTAELAGRLWGGARLPIWGLTLATVIVVCSLASIARLAQVRRRAGQPLPAAVWAVVGGQLCWFCLGAWHPFFNIALVPVFHSAQYLALTSWHETRGRSVGVFVAYATTVLILGLAVTPGLISLGSAFAGDGPVVVAAILSAINLHHFLMDGRIWRLREKPVAASFAAVASSSR
jgi:hypothetical protein